MEPFLIENDDVIIERNATDAATAFIPERSPPAEPSNNSLWRQASKKKTQHSLTFVPYDQQKKDAPFLQPHLQFPRRTTDNFRAKTRLANSPRNDKHVFLKRKSHKHNDSHRLAFLQKPFLETPETDLLLDLSSDETLFPDRERLKETHRGFPEEKCRASHATLSFDPHNIAAMH